MKSSRTVFCLAAIMVTGMARGDGKMYWREAIPPNIPYQRALILFKDGTQTLLIQSKYEISKTADKPALGWVVPVPSVPEVASMPADSAQEIFSDLTMESRPQVTRIGPRVFHFFYLGLACLSILILLLCLLSFVVRFPLWWRQHRGVLTLVAIVGFIIAVVAPIPIHHDARGSAGVEVMAEHQVGIYEVQVVRSNDANDLISWLNQGQFRFGEEDKAAFDSYLSKGWCFVVAHINPSDEEDEAQIVSEGLAAPLILRFRSEAPVYPVALTHWKGLQPMIEAERRMSRTALLGLVWLALTNACSSAYLSPRHRRLLLFVLLGLAVSLSAGAAERLVDAPEPRPFRVWPSTPPADCPFPKSETLVGLGFTGRHAEYTGADTWYPSWASDGNLYSPWTDGNVNGLGVSSAGEAAATGHATILGDDPLHLRVMDQGVFKSSPRPYEGRYPCGSLVYNGVWYYGTYCLHPSGGIRRDGILYNWPWMGPFVGFRWSTDLGKTWTQTPCTPERPLFGEHALNGEPVQIGAPHFVDLGRNMEHSPDGKAYLVAQGASDGRNRRFAFNSWITADQVCLIRVTPGIGTLNDASKYEFFAGHGQDGDALWSGDFSKIRPIAEWRDRMGCVTMTYDPPLKRFLMAVTDGGNTVSRYNTYLLESERITGPWRLVTHMSGFGEQAYFVNVPSKFIGGDGRTLWLCYSANFSSGWGGTTFRSRPSGSRYALCLQEVRLLAPGESADTDILSSPDNVAQDAKVSVSSTHPDYSADGTVDGVVDGFPRNLAREWATAGEQGTAMLRLTWGQPQTIDRVWLFDRPNDLDQVTSGMLVFSDGSTLATGALPDDARKGLEVRFAPKTVDWLVFVVTGVKKGSPNIGISEIAVFTAGR